MPKLPEAGPPELKAEDRLLLLLASAAQSGGRLSPEAWKRALDILEASFRSTREDGPTAYEDQAFFLLQAKFHSALLKRPSSPAQFASDPHLAEDLASLPPHKAMIFANGVSELSSEYGAILFEALPEEAEKKNGVMRVVRQGVRFLPGVEAWQELFGERRGDDIRATRMENGVAIPRTPSGFILPPLWRKQISLVSHIFSETGTFCGGLIEGAFQAASSQYQGAARYLGDLQLQRTFSLFSRKHQDEIVPRFREVGDYAERLKASALSIGALRTASALNDLSHLMREQPFTVVVLGEGKRGKSSLVNALLGSVLSPVRESVPETAAVARFRWGKTFSAHAQFLEQETWQQEGLFQEQGQCAALDERLKALLAEGVRSEKTLSTQEELQSILSAGDKRSIFSVKADVFLPAEILEDGLALVDTPGLNAVDPVQNYLAFEACLSADCLLFVMDARRPESFSERELLLQLARSGRAAAVIGVVTGIDRLNEKESRQSALDQAELLMEAARSSGMEVLGLLEINAREAMEHRCASPRRSGGSQFNDLCSLLKKAAEKRKGSLQEKEERVRQRGVQVLEALRNEVDAFLAYERSLFPDNHHVELLSRHVDRLESVLEACSSQAWSVVNAASIDMDAWEKEQRRALDAWQEKTVLRILDAAHRHADTLGYTGMFRPKNWKRFDEEDVPRIAREALEELLAERREVQRDWNEKLKQFGERMQEISVLCLDAVLAGELELSSISDVPFSHERWLVNASSLMKKVGLVGLGLAIRRGGGVGLGIVLGNMGWWALLPVAVVGSVVWTLVKFGSPSRCRRIFMERKEAAVKKWAEAQRKRLDELLDQNLEELTSAYGKAVTAGFLPALSVLAEEASALRAYVGVVEKIRQETELCTSSLLNEAEHMENALDLLAVPEKRPDDPSGCAP